MNIRWNSEQGRFEAEFSKDFNNDLDRVKTAKFKTDGQPNWVWWTKSVQNLNKLRQNKPPSGLTITPEAFEVYKTLQAQYETNQQVKKEFKQANKKAIQARQPSWLPAGKEYLTKEDLPPMPPFVPPVGTTPMAVPDLKCIECGSPVYFYEFPEIPMCLWCDKIALEKL